VSSPDATTAPLGDPSGTLSAYADHDDHALARDLARAAGERLVALRGRLGERSAADVRADGDRMSHHLLVDALARLRPADAVLSEEAVDDPVRLRSDRVWIIDPLDGTREFGEPDRTDWAVHVALWERGALVAGAVALPARGSTLWTGEPSALSAKASAGTPGAVRVAVSRTRPPALLDTLATLMDLELVPMGSAGVKVTAVVTGEVDAYLHAGGQYEWDSAAPVAVAVAAGAHASRIDGAPLRYNQPNPLLPDLLVCRSERADGLLAAIRRASVTVSS